ncbi:Pfs, NACHT and ankyrin domain protein, partial [Aureobasidium melanogenum]
MMANLQALESGDMYTVGWISALPLELAAATAMLDEEHAIPTDFNRSPSDQNNYTFGRMGEHNLVIASLPAGVYGTTSAATTASQMLSSFPNIRIGLMVGIGAGIPKPEEYDIRLGDVVVSQPHGTSGGVVQYDLGKAKADGSFEQKGMLNMPPLALLNALSNLQARHIKLASKISPYVNKMLEQFPLMKKRRPKMPSYMYQGVDHDKLFEPAYLHLGGPSCTACETGREITRDVRESTDPEIHYGIIASGNTLVKDAVQRDTLAKDTGEDCICFEMEAAGIMNTFPCVVIRGICDYADSHKNDRWQGYAAATAAAYAKELLEVIPCGDLQRTERAIKVLQEVQKTVRDTNKNVEKLCVYALSDSLKEWLHAPDPSTNYNRAIQQRHPGTGLWFLESEVYEGWRVEENGFLWLHGLAGCGKTVLSSSIIEDLQKHPPSPRTNLLYFFFDFNDKEKQSHEKMIRTFIQQLYVQEEASRHILEQLFERCAGGHEQPSLTSLEDAFASMLNQAARTRVVIDALDESGQQRNTLEWLRRISTNQRSAPNKLNVIITSRREYDIEFAFLKWMPERNVLPIRADDVNKDISDFVCSQIQLDQRLERWRERPNVQTEIESKLIEKANGMFRWVTCQLDTLENCLDLADLRKALDDLPDGLNGTYSRILARVDARNQEKAIAMLQLLVWAERELTLNELVDALAVRQVGKRLQYDPRNKIPVPNEIVKILPGLIVLDAKECSSTLVRVHVLLAHLSVKEYLTSDCVHETFKSHLGELNAHIAISDMCIAHCYTSHPESHVLDAVYHSNETDDEAKDLPWFVRYVYFWPEHAKVAQVDESASKRILKFLTNGFAPDSPFARCILPGHDVNPLHYASSEGLSHVIAGLLEHDAHVVDSEDKSGGTALDVATETCHEEVVRLLLLNGASPTMYTVPDVETFCEDDTGVDLRILRMLLDHGAKPTYDALIWAVQLGKAEIVQFLLDNGAPMTGKIERYSLKLWRSTSLLHIACKQPEDDDDDDRIDIIRMILNHGAEIDALDEKHRTALDLAYTDTVKRVLLDHGADVTASRYKGRPPLHGAVMDQRPQKVLSLLDSGVDIDAQDKEGRTALHEAAMQAYRWPGEFSSSFVKRLLDRGADALIKDCSGRSALDVIESRFWWNFKSIEEEESVLRVYIMLTKSMWKQLRSAQAVSKKRRKRPRPLCYKGELTSRERRPYGLTFHPADPSNRSWMSW